MPRSMRSTAPSPHTCAMSVALLDHDEIVPARGTTMTIFTRASACGDARALDPRPVGQQPLEDARLRRRRAAALGIDEMHEARA